MDASASQKPPRKPGPKPDLLKIDLPLGEALRRLAQSPRMPKAGSPYAGKRKRHKAKRPA